MKLLPALPTFVFSFFIGISATAQDVGAPPATMGFNSSPLIVDGLLDPSAPIEHRRDLARQLIDAADREKSPNLLYLVGSLYRQGDSAGIAPFPQDLDRAREYLTRAALGGYIDAMSKLAVVELDSGNRFEANLWAQLYVHYSEIDDSAKARRRTTGSESLAAALLSQTSDGFPKSEIPRLIERANALVVQYDAVIRAYQAAEVAEQAKPSFPKVSPHDPTLATRAKVSNQLGRTVASAQAEYFVEFSPAGELLRIWPLDGWPDQKAIRVLRSIISGCVLNPAPAGKTENRVFLIPVAFVKPTFHLKQNDGKK